MMSSADHRDLSVVCKAQSSKIVGGLLEPRGGGGGRISPTPPPCGPALENHTKKVVLAIALTMSI